MNETDRSPADCGRRALVVFDGRASLPWLRLLRPGFRHCMVVVESDGGWVLLNPLSGFTEILALPLLTAEDIRTHFTADRYRIVEWHIPEPLPRAPAPWGPYTCVEVVKRTLGIHDRWVMTPWRLFRHLQKISRKKFLDLPPALT